MKVTILITNYNYGKYLSRCIRSCINQNFKDYEILIVDDCSTDNSLNIINRYLPEFDSIRLYVNQKNIGLGATCGRGVSLSRGKYIVRVDADDYISEDFLKCLYLWASFNNSNAVACDYFKVDLNENIIGRFSQRDNPIACGIMFRTDLLELVGSYKDLKINEDIDLLNRFKKEFNLEYLNIPLYRYFIHENSLTSRGS